jgi:hypothetical protein
MVRSAAAILALLILPSFAQGQEPVGTHTVVGDDTLWDLAQLYYGNPFEWRVILEANRDSINDGITVGDEFVLYGAISANDTRGSLQVVGVTQSMVAARIASMADDIFRQDVIVRLAKKMP